MTTFVKVVFVLLLAAICCQAEDRVHTQLQVNFDTCKNGNGGPDGRGGEPDGPDGEPGCWPFPQCALRDLQNNGVTSASGITFAIPQHHMQTFIFTPSSCEATIEFQLETAEHCTKVKLVGTYSGIQVAISQGRSESSYPLNNIPKLEASTPYRLDVKIGTAEGNRDCDVDAWFGLCTTLNQHCPLTNKISIRFKSRSNTPGATLTNTGAIVNFLHVHPYRFANSK